MKKVTLFAVAIAAMTFAACGGNKTAQTVEDTDSVKTFEQEQIEANIKVQFDSLASELGKLKQLPVVTDGENGIKLTDEEKQVKPDYLLAPAVAENATTLSEKYRLISALGVDKKVAELYGMPTDEYEKALGKLVADVNDPSFKEIENAGTLFETGEALYNAMSTNGRINYFWQMVGSSLVEQLYITSQNSDKFLASFTDDAAANITFRIVLIQDCINRLSEYDPELVEVAKAIEPLNALNATTVSELKGQMEQMKQQIDEARQSLTK